MERLAARLLELAFEPTDDVFDVPVIAVQGRGMERWLAQYCADATGIFSSVRITRVRGFVDLVCDAMLGGVKEQRLDPATLPFRIAKHLDAVVDSPDGEAFARYVAAADVDRRMQLVERLADVFDRYFVHRPKLVASWLGGDVDDSPIARAEAALLRLVVADAPGYEGRRIADAIARLDRATPLLTSSIPRRTFFFGVGTLAPLYLELLRAVAVVADIHLFVLTPGETWLSDLGRDESARGEIGSIIRGFGKLTAEFQDLLEDASGHSSEYLGDDFPTPDTVLRVLQHDLCTLTPRGEGPGREPRVEVSGDDRSFVVHACHSPMRELEVLHELVVDRLERDPTLMPHDIAVLTTDIERYAPLVHAVFGRERNEEKRVPYHVADRGPRESFGFVDSFLAVVEASDERLSLPLVADLLDRAAIRQRFDLERDDVEVAVRWLRDAGARWGADVADREREGQPGFVEHTFEHALDRLALSFVVPSDADPFCGVCPSTAVTGKESDVLEGLYEFFEALSSLRIGERRDGTVAEHVAFSERVLERILDSGPRFDEEAQLLRVAFATMRDRARDAEYEGPISRASFIRLLTSELDESTSTGFLGGGVTFCRQVPMRAIPFRVICLLGLDDGSFPRNVEAPRFDLVAHHPLKGDRSVRDDDRQAFLETILSARDELHLFHVGKDIATNTERAVSAVVGRTLEVVERAVARADGGRVRDLLWVEHPLHGFDPSYFVEDARSRGLVSRDSHAFRCASASIGPKVAPHADFSIGAGASPEPIVRFDDLLRFVERPESEFLSHVLGIATDDDDATLPEREALSLEALEEFHVVDRALALVRRGDAPPDVRTRLRAEARLPPGAAGELAADHAIGLAVELLDRSTRAAPSRVSAEPLAFRIELESAALVGALHGVEDTGLHRVVASKLRVSRKFRSYVEALVLALVAPDHVARRVTLVGRTMDNKSSDRVEEFVLDAPGESEARAQLTSLVVAYQAARLAPLIVAPEVLDSYSKARSRNESRDEALDAAASTFAKPFDGREAPEAARRVRLFREAFGAGADDRSKELLGARFADVAEAVFLPFRARVAGAEDAE